ncbi:MAG TPA: 3'-5' exonuclease [Candidatus Binataceae bacterium]|nr:3'-5' exonuclease [Candidatus Binataceae bacterium]
MQDGSPIRATSEAAARKARDRREAIAWARALIDESVGWVILDTETTGLGLTDEVIQIGIIAPDGSALLDSLVRPLKRQSIPGAATAVHGIKIEQLAGAPTFPELAPRLEEILRERRVVAYNAEYDRRLIKQTALLSAVPSPKSRWECAMRAYSRFIGEWDFRKNDYRFQRLPSGDHSAIGDCRATLKIIGTMASALD